MRPARCPHSLDTGDRLAIESKLRDFVALDSADQLVTFDAMTNGAPIAIPGKSSNGRPIDPISGAAISRPTHPGCP